MRDALLLDNCIPTSVDHGANALKLIAIPEISPELLLAATTLKALDLAYHSGEEPLVADAEYDQLRRRYVAAVGEGAARDAAAACAIYDPVRTVGAPAASSFADVVHDAPMMSLENAFHDEDVQEFASRVAAASPEGACNTINAEPKIDGLSLSLLYVDGRLARAATRGDGRVGEDVTANAMAIADIPHNLGPNAPSRIEIRGEVYMRKSTFDRLNADLEARSAKLMSNTRNAAAGALRLSDPKESARRQLSFFVYGAFAKAGLPALSQSELLALLGSWGFVTNPLSRHCTTADEAIAIHREILLARPDLDYEIDGVVYKADKFKTHDALGASSRAPRWAVAHKFPAMEASTILEGIDIQVGRSGALSPVARLRPVNVGGVVVSNATLHNEDYIAGRGADGLPIRDGRDLRIGDRVTIYRAGDVIPKILDVDVSAREPQSTPYAFPSTCPACGAPAVRASGDATRRCTGGLSCDAQIHEALRHFVSRDAFDIDGLGPRQIEQFMALGWVTAPADIFDLEARRQSISSLEGWGARSADNLLASVFARRQVSLHKLLHALGIRHMGAVAARAVAKQYRTWQAFDEAVLSRPDAGDMLRIDGVGPALCQAVEAFMANPATRAILQNLLDRVEVLPEPDQELAAGQGGSPSPIEGKTIVFTGKLALMSRDEAKAKAESIGATVSGSISRATDILVAGEKAGSKRAKAEALGVQVMSETEWAQLIEGH
jgi:DNA ligase (NAD+)